MSTFYIKLCNPIGLSTLFPYPLCNDLYKMRAIRLSVSLSTELHHYLKDNPQLSPSKILQVGIKNIIEHRKFFEKEKQLLNKRIDFLQEKLQEANEKLMADKQT